ACRRLAPPRVPRQGIRNACGERHHRGESDDDVSSGASAQRSINPSDLYRRGMFRLALRRGALTTRYRRFIVVFAALVSVCGPFLVGTREEAATTLPRRLTDRAFWKLVTDFSEPGGVFCSENLLSNELTFQEVIPDLQKRASPDAVYFGVGPDQNFTYIAAL